MSMQKIMALRGAGLFKALDVQMAGLVLRMCPDTKEEVLLAVAMASRAVGLGHACVNLAAYAGRSWADIMKDAIPAAVETGGAEVEGSDELPEDPAIEGVLPTLPAWESDLLESGIAGDGNAEGKARKLFVLENSRLYLRRFWRYERGVENALAKLHKAETGVIADAAALDKRFGDDEDQREAAKKAIERRLSVLSGGPGTGKTTTLAKAVALMAEMNDGSEKPPDVRMVAPTGKAAVRMVESVKSAKERLAKSGYTDDMLKAIPEDASTIHRLLGYRPRSPYFRHDAKNRLTADMVIVDEASMVDLPLMAKLLEAIPDACSLMLVGDTDQLASVEPGRVYLDVCKAAERKRPLEGCLTQLLVSWRFPDNSVIGGLSKLVNAGDEAKAWECLQASADSHYMQVHDSSVLVQESGAFEVLVAEKLTDFLEETDPPKVLAAAGDFRVLCAHRRGPFGVQSMNRRVEKILSEKGLAPGGRFYDHQLVMVTVNTPQLGLYNGDVGVILAEKGTGKREYKAWFDVAGKGVRPLSVNLLPHHETAFAMTVHKSQGSEFPYVALVLPDTDDSPILTRELLYTGMTRVKIDEEKGTGKLYIWCTETSFDKAVSTKTDRATGLFAPAD